jgi:hypothetical protein
LENDLETARIILAVQEKAAKWQPPRQPSPAIVPEEIERPFRRTKILPQSGESDTEEHTSGLDELDDLAAYVAARSSPREQTLVLVPLDAEQGSYRRGLRGNPRRAD